MLLLTLINVDRDQFCQMLCDSLYSGNAFYQLQSAQRSHKSPAL